MKDYLAAASLLFLASCGPIYGTPPSVGTPNLGQIVAWKNFQMPKTVFTVPAGPPSTPQEPGGPGGSDPGTFWYKTNMPLDPSFTKLRSDTGLKCGLTIDVHPNTTDAFYFALLVRGADGKSGFGGIILANASPRAQVFTIDSGDHMYVDIPAGKYMITTWATTANQSGAWFDSPEEFMQCFEVALPKSQ